MIYFCCDNERRRNAVLAHPSLNGIDFLEVSDDPSDPFEKRQRILFVHFLKDLTPGVLTAANVRIDGGERILRGEAVAHSVVLADDERCGALKHRGERFHEIDAH